MGALNIDADEIKRHKLIQEEAQMVEFHNGCICCTLRGDLLETIKQLSEELDEAGDPTYEYIVIESTGISEPLPIAQTFVMDVTSCGPISPTVAAAGAGDVSPMAESGVAKFDPLSKYAQLDTLVTVVDLHNILHVLGGDQTVPGERERLVGDEKEGDGKPTSLYQLLVDQLEFANVILLNKVDLLHPDDAEARYRKIMQIGRLVRKFNPDARVLVPGYKFEFDGSNTSELASFDKPVSGRLAVSKFEDFDVAQIIDTRLFDMEKAQMSAGWIRELQKDVSGEGHTPETEEYGIGSFVWRTSNDDPRPLHPERLSSILNGFGHMPGEKSEDGVFAGVVRSKGQLWLANCNAIRIDFHTAGRQVNLESGMAFLAAVPRKYWDAEAWRQHLEYKNAGRWQCGARGHGDRSSYLVIIGVELSAERKQQITEELNGALLTDDEMAVGETAFLAGKDDDHPWKNYPDPIFGSNVNELWKFTMHEEEEEEEDDELSRVMKEIGGLER